MKFSCSQLIKSCLWGQQRPQNHIRARWIILTSPRWRPLINWKFYWESTASSTGSMKFFCIIMSRGNGCRWWSSGGNRVSISVTSSRQRKSYASRWRFLMPIGLLPTVRPLWVLHSISSISSWLRTHNLPPSTAVSTSKPCVYRQEPITFRTIKWAQFSTFLMTCFQIRSCCRRWAMPR